MNLYQMLSPGDELNFSEFNEKETAEFTENLKQLFEFRDVESINLIQAPAVTLDGEFHATMTYRIKESSHIEFSKDVWIYSMYKDHETKDLIIRMLPKSVNQIKQGL